MTQLIKPASPGGFRDYLPEVMIPKQEILGQIRKTFESFGFQPLETHAVELSSVLGTDQDTFNMEVFNLQTSGQTLTLRFDLTVPLSRVIAANPLLLKPFKRYQLGPVWRAEKPQAGRFREFLQFDADIVGSDSIIADTEIVLLMYQAMVNLGLTRFVIRFNNRKILNGLPQACDFDPTKAPSVFRILDKLEKIGWEEVQKELQRLPDNQYDDSAPALSQQACDLIGSFLEISQSTQPIPMLESFFAQSEIAREGINECRQIIAYLNALKIPTNNWQLDLSVARGLGYYTGPVFETTLLDIPEIGSVFSGGRFDELVMRFTGQKMPAVGASVGVDRLMAALEQLGSIEKKRTLTKAMILSIGQELEGTSLALAQSLRKRGVNTEVYLGKDSSLGAQIGQAAKQEIPFVIIIGQDEVEQGLFRLKDMEQRTEEALTIEDLLDKLT